MRFTNGMEFFLYKRTNITKSRNFFKKVVTNTRQTTLTKQMLLLGAKNWRCIVYVEKAFLVYHSFRGDALESSVLCFGCGAVWSVYWKQHRQRFHLSDLLSSWCSNENWHKKYQCFWLSLWKRNLRNMAESKQLLKYQYNLKLHGEQQLQYQTRKILQAGVFSNI